MSEKNLFERNPKKTIFVFLAVAAIFLDLILGFFFITGEKNSHRIPHRFYHHALKPNSSAIDNYGPFKVAYKINSLGFKDREIRDIPLESDTKRAIFIGDSFTEGVGIDHEKTFVGLLDSQLKDVEVFNAGVLSYSPKLYYLKTKFLLENIGLKFDELYVFIDISDIQDEYLYENFEPTDILFLKLFWFNLKKTVKNSSLVFNKISQSQNFFSMSDESLFPEISEKFRLANTKQLRDTRSLWTFKKYSDQDWVSIGIDLAVTNMQKLADLCLKNNIKLNIVVYPNYQQVIAKDINCIQADLWKRFSEKNSLQFINFFPVLINKSREEGNLKLFFEKYYISDYHWNENGHKLIAKTILDSREL